MNRIYLYILVMAAVTYAIRVTPLTLIRKQIKNRFILSFLYYVPYITLAVMTVPDIFDAAGSLSAGVIVLAVGIFSAWMNFGLFPTAAICCVTALATQMIF